MGNHTLLFMLGDMAVADAVTDEVLVLLLQGGADRHGAGEGLVR